MAAKPVQKRFDAKENAVKVSRWREKKANKTTIEYEGVEVRGGD
jgi:hypothetical protein